MRTTGKQCGLAATGGYQPSLRSPWLAAVDGIRNTHYPVNYTFSTYSTNDRSPLHTSRLHTSRLFLCAIDKAYTILMLEGISLTLDFVVGQAI